MTAPEQWAVVQEVETVTGDFLTEPGVPFYRIVIDGYCADFDHRQAAENFVAAIQRAFEERERKLRENLEMIPAKIVFDALHTFASMEPEEDETWESWFHAAFDMTAERIDRRAREILAARQALKETPDAQ